MHRQRHHKPLPKYGYNDNGNLFNNSTQLTPRALYHISSGLSLPETVRQLIESPEYDSETRPGRELGELNLFLHSSSFRIKYLWTNIEVFIKH